MICEYKDIVERKILTYCKLSSLTTYSLPFILIVQFTIAADLRSIEDRYRR